MALFQLDMDSCRAYEHAMERVNNEKVRVRLQELRSEHEHHIEELREKITDMGGEVPLPEAHLRGFFHDSLKTLNTMTEIEQILTAVQGGERLTNKTHTEALQLKLTDDARAVVEKHLQDEQRHLQLIKEAIATRMWVR